MVPLFRSSRLGLAGIAALMMMLWVGWQGKPLKTATTPLGILQLELVKTGAEAAQVVAAWKHLKAVAQNNIVIDYAFLLAYSWFFVQGLSYWFRRRGRSLPGWLWLAAIIPGLLDAVENLFLWRWLQHTPPDGIVRLVYTMVIVKFALALVLLLISFPAWLHSLFMGRKNENDVH